MAGNPIADIIQLMMGARDYQDERTPFNMYPNATPYPPWMGMDNKPTINDEEDTKYNPRVLKELTNPKNRMADPVPDAVMPRPEQYRLQQDMPRKGPLEDTYIDEDYPDKDKQVMRGGGGSAVAQMVPQIMRMVAQNPQMIAQLMPMVDQIQPGLLTQLAPENEFGEDEDNAS